jgi:hypothetical protein
MVTALNDDMKFRGTGVSRGFQERGRLVNPTSLRVIVVLYPLSVASCDISQ